MSKQNSIKSDDYDTLMIMPHKSVSFSTKNDNFSDKKKLVIFFFCKFIYFF